MQNKPTLKTISAASGYAMTTVSRALAGDEKIAETTRSQVMRIAQDLGYVPDRAAQRLRTGRTSVIALVLPPHDEILGFRGSMIAGLSEALSKTQFHISMTPYGVGEDSLRPITHIVRNRLADGIVFSGTFPDDPRVAFLTTEGFPFVSHGQTDFAEPHPWCDYDNAAFARMAVERMAARGRRRLVLIPPAPGRTYCRHMIEGFLNTCAELGVTGRMEPGITLATPLDHLNAFVAKAQAAALPPNGYICPGEVPTMAVLAALTDGSLRVGEDVDVIAKQTSPVFEQYRPRIDTIYEDIRAAGETLGELLLRRIAGEPVQGLNVLHAPKAMFRTG
jgi:LacI family transcriptional regulator